MNRLEIVLNMETFEVRVGHRSFKAATYEDACTAFDALNKLRDERDDLDRWCDRYLDHLTKFPRLPSHANGARPPSGEK